MSIENENREIEKMVGIICTNQSMINQIDGLANETVYVRELKKRGNAFSNFLEKFLKDFYDFNEVTEIDKVNEKALEIDEVVKAIKIG